MSLRLAVRDGGYAWLPAIACFVVQSLLLLWSVKIKRVSVDGNSFVIVDYATTHRVPISHLQSISEHSNFIAPTILLHFDPPTPFGRSIHIIPPVRMFGGSRYDEAVSFLNSQINEREPNVA